MSGACIKRGFAHRDFWNSSSEQWVSGQHVQTVVCRCCMTLTRVLRWGLMLSTPLLLDGVSGIGMIGIVILVITTVSIIWISSLMHRPRQSMRGKLEYTSARCSMKFFIRAITLLLNETAVPWPLSSPSPNLKLCRNTLARQSQDMTRAKESNVDHTRAEYS